MGKTKKEVLEESANRRKRNEEMATLAREGLLPSLKAARMSAPPVKLDLSNCYSSSGSDEEEETNGPDEDEEKKGPTIKVEDEEKKGPTIKVVTPEKAREQEEEEEEVEFLGVQYPDDYEVTEEQEDDEVVFLRVESPQ